jgi:hypothetical protein
MHMIARLAAPGALAAALIAAPVFAQPALEAATLPDARSVTVGSPATYFASVVNSGDATATNCAIALDATDGSGATLAYQTTDVSNALTGAPNTPVDIPAGATQGFLVSITPGSAYEGEVRLAYACDNGRALGRPRVNDVHLTAQASAAADLITVMSTPSGDGVLRIPAVGAGAAAAGAVINIGATASVTATPRLIGFDTSTGIDLSICETNSATGACLAARTDSLDLSLDGTARTFTVFARADRAQGAPLYPQTLRLTVDFTDNVAAGSKPIDAPQATGDPIRGRTSAAITAPPPDVRAVSDLPMGGFVLHYRDEENDFSGGDLVIANIAFDRDGVGHGTFLRDDFIPPVLQGVLVEGTFTPGDGNEGGFSGQLTFLEDFRFQDLGTTNGALDFNYTTLQGFRGLNVFGAAPGGGQSGVMNTSRFSERMRVTGVAEIDILECPMLYNIRMASDSPLPGAPLGVEFDVFLGDEPESFTIPETRMFISRQTPNVIGEGRRNFEATFNNDDSGDTATLALSGSIVQEEISGGLISMDEPPRMAITATINGRTFTGSGVLVKCTDEFITFQMNDGAGNSPTVHLRPRPA